ncbi:cytochrome P450 [Phenylobacterium sp. LjRoot219]|uniref:cytochrome P450 n=1 Tax=Phenylobacterium sp. LjRoot219 TaxID=3342283 RepID=UPI003ECC6C25
MHAPSDLAQTIVDPTAYADGRIHAAFAQLRREAPLAQVQVDGYNPFWAVTRHADIMEVERRSADFSSGDSPVTLMSREAVARAAASGFQGPRTLVQLDGGEHLALRQLTQGWFMPQNLRKLEARIRELARGSIDRMAALGGECDFAREIALYYPLRVIMEILGVPEADEPLMLKLTQEMFAAEDKELNRSGVEVDSAAALDGIRAAVMEFAGYFSQMIQDRRSHPRDDLASVIANGEIDGQPLGFPEAIGYYMITATAGHDTTSHTTAMGLWALAERPELLRALKADPSLIPAHVDESVRWATAVKHFMRTATADVELNGQQIAKGDWLMLCYASGNRDETVFDRPFEYDIQRAPNRHIAFGYGPHVCIGQHLGKMEMRIFWEELLPRLESLELAGQPALTAATFVSGPKHLPVRYKLS